MDVLSYTPGSTPLLISVPHAGTGVPEEIAPSLAEPARALPDTDWYVDRLYAVAAELGAGLLVARLSRMVVDLNRPPDDAPLYPGQAGTGLVPRTLFDGTAAWTGEVDEAEVGRRRERYWRPYHTRLGGILDEIKQRHGHAVLWEAHSIRCRVPRLFDGRLPDLNLGTNEGRSCDPGLQARLEAVLTDLPFSSVVNGRFRGGYITRHYGQPARGVHAIQLEVAQDCYMQEDPPAWVDAKARRFQDALRQLLGAARDWRPE